MRYTHVACFLALLLFSGCDERPSSGIGEARASTRAPTKIPAPAPPPVVVAQEDELAEPEEPVHVYENGRHVRVDEHQKALHDGYTVIDLSNDWAPYILG